MSSPPGDFYPHGIKEALGNVVILWSNIEALAEQAILSLGELQDSFPAQLLIFNMDMRARLSGLKAICFTTMRTDHFTEAERWINHIDGDLRSYRNRLIHDQWHVNVIGLMQGDTHASRRTTNLKIIQEPPAGKKTLHMRTTSPVYAEDIVEFCRDLDDAKEAIFRMRMYDYDSGFSEPLPPISCRHKSGPRHPSPDQGPDQTRP